MAGTAAALASAPGVCLAGTAGAAIRTSNAPLAALFGLDDVGKCTANDQNNYGNHDPIYKLHSISLSNIVIFVMRLRLRLLHA